MCRSGNGHFGRPRNTRPRNTVDNSNGRRSRMGERPRTLLDLPRTDAPEARAGDFIQRYRTVRGQTERLCEPLVAEDYVVQSMPDVSPTKWHLAHTSWFFETF